MITSQKYCFSRNSYSYLVLALWVLAMAFTARPSNAAPAPESFADLSEKLLPSVVNVSSTMKMEPATEDLPGLPTFPPGSPMEEFFDNFMQRHGQLGPNIPQSSLGSGFVVDAENGYIITNNHVIRDADEVRVTFHDDETLVAEVIGHDEKTDIAVLKVTTNKKLEAVDFGNSDELRVGDWVVAIGNPFGLGGTVTAGIISARQRDINAGPYDDFLQTDASINRGNSGGPMFNLKGEVIGINTAIFSPTGGSVGIGFAIPSMLAKPVVDQIIKYGRTRRGWLGVRIQSVTEEIAESLGLEKAHGAMISSVLDGSPSAKAGLKAGDIILSYNGSEVKEMRELPKIVADTEIGTDAEVVFWRDSKEQTTTVTIGELEKAEEDGLIPLASHNDETKPEKGITLDILKLTVQSLSQSDRNAMNIDKSVQGLLVTDVENYSNAAEKGISPGDLIIEINQTPVTTPEQAKDALKAAQDKGRKSVLLLLNRDGDMRFTALKLEADKEKQK